MAGQLTPFCQTVRTRIELQRAARVATLFMPLFAALILIPQVQVLAQAQPAPDQPATVNLPLKKVVLYTAGVGFFERSGDVNGSAVVDLQFNSKDINDLLKSMVVQDTGGGKVSTVDFGSRDPITKTLKSFAIDLTNNPTLADLLRQVRGEKIRIEVPEEVNGTIVGLEIHEEKTKDDVVMKVEYLNLLTDGGLRRIPLASISSIKLANPKLDAELRQALTVLAGSHDNEKKSVAVHFHGTGNRAVKIGYIQETPLWKTSYRLVLSDNDKKSLLQGWAIVENTSDDDWNGVMLTLVSGRPVSFIMDLYQPLYVPRPTVVPELFASLRPQTYEQNLARRSGRGGAMGGVGSSDEEVRRKLADEAQPPAPAAAPMDAAAGVMSLEAKLSSDGRFFAGQGAGDSVTAMAAAETLGELFQYQISTPVTLPRQKSAMLPIVNGDVEAEKVSIYNPNVGLKHPLSGLKLKNTTTAHLMQGPVTVFDAGAYAGEAQIKDLPAGAERLLSYAIDLNTEVALTDSLAGEPYQLVSLKLVKGTAILRNKLKRGQTYTIKNSGEKKKTVIVERAVEPGWELIIPKDPAERTATLYRFNVEVPAGESVDLKVEEERILEEHIALTNIDDDRIRIWMSAPSISKGVKDALQEIVKRQMEIRSTEGEKQRLEQQIAAITQEQTRIRENMDRLNRNEQLYQRYVKKFSEQEDQVESLRTKIDELATKAASLKQALDVYLAGLKLDE